MEDDNVLELVSEQKSMSRSLEDYGLKILRTLPGLCNSQSTLAFAGAQKSTAITVAKRWLIIHGVDSWLPCLTC